MPSETIHDDHVNHDHSDDNVHFDDDSSDNDHVNNPNHPIPNHYNNLPILLQSTHLMQNLSKDGICKPQHVADFSFLAHHDLHVALLTYTTPKGYKFAAKNPHWLAAMHEEIETLRTKNTWGS